MKVLLLFTDLYRHLGGGQTVAKQIIASAPDIQFSYFRVLESADAARPANTAALPLLAPLSVKLRTPPPHQRHIENALAHADAIARSVAGQTFDIVEIPDFESYGSLLKSAFARHNVKVGRIVLALHGNISTSIAMNWGSTGNRTLALETLEKQQFADADGIYGISRRYIEHWKKYVDRDVHYIDPANFVFNSPAAAWAPSPGTRPSLYCIGRSERRKGNDLFIELVRWLDPGSYSEAAHIGPVDLNSGVSSASLLENMAKRRGLNVRHLPPLDNDQLTALYERSSIVVLPVRYDTLNLVALEALFSGCPVAVSSEAGVCDYLDQEHPHLPYVKIDLNNFYSAVPALRDLVENYEDRRRALHSALAQNPPKAKTPLDIKSIYESILASPAQHARLVPYEEDKASLKRRAIDLARRATPDSLKSALRPAVRAPRRFMIEWIRRAARFDAYFLYVLLDSAKISRRFRRIERHPEHSQDALRKKLSALYAAASNPVLRCNFWMEIARIERLRGNELMAVAYELRLLRLLGDDRLGLLPRVADSLRRNGFPNEAEAAEALYSDPDRAEERVYALLKKRMERLRRYEEKPLDVIDDRRSRPAKVSVIVSLYNAADKLNVFLTALAQQTLVRNGEVEVILVDSGSPTNEREVFEAFHRDNSLNVLYVRSKERETIQAAWNRGILLARAPYLVFLGVDETLYPEALEVLAGELDRNPGIDWVMGDSIVTTVNRAGLLEADVMSYRRTGATKDHVYLETTYLSWVGGMYRKTLHDRCGYYDESFRGAGDTEFKNRVLPYIQAKFIDQALGLFLNYPDGQTTASPMAEIEDSRAWYLYRTSGGVHYGFENRLIPDAERLLQLCAGYRKSYAGHISSDVDYGALLADYILHRDSKNALTRELVNDFVDLRAGFRQLEFSDRFIRSAKIVSMIASVRKAARRCQLRHRKMIGGQVAYDIFNDNRYEQHSWLWKSEDRTP